VGNGCTAGWWTARWKRALLLAKSERRWAMDALLGGREKWTTRWKRALLLAKSEKRWALDALLSSTTAGFCCWLGRRGGGQ